MGTYPVNKKKAVADATAKLPNLQNMPQKYIAIAACSLMLHLQSHAQFVNSGDLYVSKKGILAIHDDAHNRPDGDIVNDGNVYYHANLYNAGLITFSPAIGGNTFFSGLENQVIQTDLESEFFNITFNNSSAQPAIFQNGNISVANRADFRRGIVNGSPFGSSFTFLSNAYHTGASDNSHIDGMAQKKDYDGFEFPVGDSGKLRTAILGAPSDSSARVQYFLENSNTLHSHGSKEQDIWIIDNSEYWNIDGIAGNNALLTLEWDEATTPAQIIAPLDQTSIQIVGWNSVSGRWERQVGGQDMDSGKVTALVSKSGTYTLARVKVSEQFPKDITIYNGMSPNNDGINDIFVIGNISKYPRNWVEIYNRWGAKVYQTEGYGQNGNWFSGISEGDITINRGEKLPSGTYFYIIKLKATHGNTVDKTGYLYIN